MGLVGSEKAESFGSTRAWVTTETTSGPRGPATFRRARVRRLPSWPWVMPPRTKSGWAGTRSEPSSCWMARLPTCGPLPWTTTTSQPVHMSEHTERAMRAALASCSS